MGASSSKAARGATRKFPNRPPPSAVSQPVASRPRQPPATEPASRPQSDGSKDDAIRADAMDPDSISASFSSRLHQMGIAEPNPTFSPSSTASTSPQFPTASTGPLPHQPLYPAPRANTTLSALEARRRLQEEADREFETGTSRRRFVDVRTVVDAVRLRDNGWSDGDIEKRLGVKEGFMKKLGRKGLLRHVMTGED
ncbi:hypothetical protein LIA77_11388 [Sarocladium implicatum]|nr:hypothetical protein LIA77_11388 [Sarocladium implicatum]